MGFSEEQQRRAIELLRKDASKRKQNREYMKEYRQKLREQGIKQKSSFSENNRANVQAFYHKNNAILAIKYLFRNL